MNESSGVITDARELGTVKMLILGLQHMFAMFGATILVPILVNSYFVDACGEGPTRGLTVAVTLFCAGFGILRFFLRIFKWFCNRGTSGYRNVCGDGSQ